MKCTICYYYAYLSKITYTLSTTWCYPSWIKNLICQQWIRSAVQQWTIDGIKRNKAPDLWTEEQRMATARYITPPWLISNDLNFSHSVFVGRSSIITVIGQRRRGRRRFYLCGWTGIGSLRLSAVITHSNTAISWLKNKHCPPLTTCLLNPITTVNTPFLNHPLDSAYPLSLRAPPR